MSAMTGSAGQALGGQEDQRMPTTSTERNTQYLETSTPSQEKEQEKPACRICLEESDSASLICPCLCKGTMKHVHLACLAEWRKSAMKDNRHGSEACEQCQFNYVDRVQLHQPIRTVLAPVALGVAGALLQTLPFVLIVLWDYLHDVQEPQRLCVPRETASESSTEVQMLVHLYTVALHPIISLFNRGQQPSGFWTTTRFLPVDPGPFLECAVPRAFTGFLTMLILSTGYLLVRIARTVYPPLRAVRAALRQPAENLRVLWSIRAGIIMYELIGRHITEVDHSPGFICLLFAGLPFILPEPLELVIQDLREPEQAPPTNSEKKDAFVQA